MDHRLARSREEERKLMIYHLLLRFRVKVVGGDSEGKGRGKVVKGMVAFVMFETGRMKEWRGGKNGQRLVIRAWGLRSR